MEKTTVNGILEETRLTAHEVASRLKIPASRVYGWMSAGFRGRRLESQRLGGRVVTSAEAVQRFLEWIAPVAAQAVESRREVQRQQKENRRALESAKRKCGLIP